jgi:hypothetical protein
MNEMLKSVFSYYDIKDTVKYLVYFTTTTASASSNTFTSIDLDSPLTTINTLNFNITDGLTVWSALLNQTALTSLITKQQLVLPTPAANNPISLSQFFDNLLDSLKSSKFELSKLVGADIASSDLIEFRVTASGLFASLSIMTAPLSSVASSHELKTLLFALHDRLGKKQFNEVESVATVRTNSAAAADGNASTASSGSRFKKFGSGPAVGARKPGMSIINPMSKRRKVPEGVKYQDGDSDEMSSGDDDDEKKKESLDSGVSGLKK